MLVALNHLPLKTLKKGFEVYLFIMNQDSKPTELLPKCTPTNSKSVHLHCVKPRGTCTNIFHLKLSQWKTWHQRERAAGSGNRSGVSRALQRFETCPALISATNAVGCYHLFARVPAARPSCLFTFPRSLRAARRFAGIATPRDELILPIMCVRTYSAQGACSAASG